MKKTRLLTIVMYLVGWAFVNLATVEADISLHRHLFINLVIAIIFALIVFLYGKSIKSSE